MSLNKVLLIGNLTADAEVRAAGSTNIATFTVATSERWKDRNGQTQTATEWHDCEMWGQDNVYKYLTKGQQVYVEGSIKTDTWESNGQKNSRKKIRVFTIQLLGQAPGQQRNDRQQQQPQRAQQQTPSRYANQNTGHYAPAGPDVTDDLPI